MHIANCEKCNWLRDKIETPTLMQYNRQRREVILDRLIWSTQFENFLATKWTTAKRFGLEGGETLIPEMKETFDRAADLGVESIVIGMPHRGRLNVLGNVVPKPLHQIFSEFSGGTKPVDGVGLYTGTGDVKYHLGISYDRPTRGGKRIHLSLVANPSLLEAVDPVVVGKTRAKQYYSNDVDRTKNMAVLIHGEGSFAGQGVVYETLHLSALPNYTTGGTIHIVVNNRVAFTTDPRAGRSSQYCTVVAKALNAPIFHVNGDDVKAVVHACELAAEWRQTFHSDMWLIWSVTVDLGIMRSTSHRSHSQRSLQIYQNKLLESGQVTEEDIGNISQKVSSILNEEFFTIKDYVPKRRDWLSAYWTGFKSPEQLSCVQNTGVKPEILKNVGKAITFLPHNFKPHRAVKKVYEQRAKMNETGEGLDWAMAEAFAFATLVVEGNHVRLSGQDVERGTFSHRHSVLMIRKQGISTALWTMLLSTKMRRCLLSAIGMFIITNFALNQGMSQHVLVVYRNAIATLVIAPFAVVFDRNMRPKMTLSVFVKILLLGLLEPTIDQNLYYTGMKYTAATFTSAMCNVLPAFAFMMAWIFKLEKVNIRKLYSQAKILGTIVTVGGAMIMTLINGPMLQLPWIKSNNQHVFSSAAAKQDPVKGALIVTIGCFCWTSFIILQAITLKSYPAELSLTALICLVGTIEGSIVALVMEGGNAAVWSIHLDVKFLAAVYGGLICSGVAYYIQGVIMKTRGPVFVTSFNPLCMIIVAILSSFILSEILYLRRVIGAVLIVIGLYLVLWGKCKDQLSSNQNIKMEASNDQKITAMDETTMVSNQNSVVLGVTSSKVTTNNESV
ncbi:hypothetical protein CRYUN_Cryun09bG0095100 [Craigia yunnanensis]